jgi:hypothetical protein
MEKNQKDKTIEELGYKINVEDETFISYRGERYLEFNLQDKKIWIGEELLTLEELKAIVKKCQELNL